jgi:hypothetical protein
MVTYHTHVATYIGYVGTVLRILENWDITAHNYDIESAQEWSNRWEKHRLSGSSRDVGKAARKN